ncbi:MAG: restriction endonuclease subunit S [Oscillospiraceae bacterium]|nr:MAG: restriction endonuclease subunit S [Oscillospiraceae bacterium]
MMIPYGYKQTEVGVIPEDWECVKIKDVATISMCKRIFANQTSTIGDVPFYKIGTFGKEADAYISSKLYVEYRNKYSFPQKKGIFLISAAGTLGRTVVYDGEKAYFQDSNIVRLDINKTRLCNEYLNQYYKVIKWASSEGSTIARLYNGIIYATYISLPPLPEQQRIAEALSDVDGMISSLEKN